MFSEVKSHSRAAVTRQGEDKKKKRERERERERGKEREGGRKKKG